MSYFFSTIRFVPDPTRGEFINLGVVAGDDESQDWELRLISNLKRAKALDTGRVLPSALTFLGELEERLPGDELVLEENHLDTDSLRRLSGEMNNIVQLSAPAPVVADSAAAALDTVFDHLVLDPEAMQFRFEKKHRAVKLARRSYKASAVPKNAVKERVEVQANHFHAPFDFAVHNGRAVQLVQCWSFQLPNQEELAEQVKAWAWVVRELREGEDGAKVLTEALEVDAPADLQIATVYIPPVDGGESSALEEARAAFAEVDVQEYTPDTADEVGERAAAALKAAA